MKPKLAIIQQLSLQLEEQPENRGISQKVQETATKLAVELILALTQIEEGETDEHEAHL